MEQFVTELGRFPKPLIQTYLSKVCIGCRSSLGKSGAVENSAYRFWLFKIGLRNEKLNDPNVFRFGLIFF